MDNLLGYNLKNICFLIGLILGNHSLIAGEISSSAKQIIKNINMAKSKSCKTLALKSQLHSDMKNTLFTFNSYNYTNLVARLDVSKIRTRDKTNVYVSSIGQTKALRLQVKIGSLARGFSSTKDSMYTFDYNEFNYRSVKTDPKENSGYSNKIVLLASNKELDLEMDLMMIEGRPALVTKFLNLKSGELSREKVLRGQALEVNKIHMLDSESYAYENSNVVRVATSQIIKNEKIIRNYFNYLFNNH